MRRERPIIAYRNCRGSSRGERAAEGALLGAIVGVAAGGLLAGLVAATGARKGAVLVVGLGIFGAVLVGQTVSEAWPPEC